MEELENHPLYMTCLPYYYFLYYLLFFPSSERPYIFTKSEVKTFAKNLAIETTYKIKLKEIWKGRKLRTLLTQLHEMFKNVLDKTRGDDQDLGRVG
jgi:hypothetical protein